MLFIFLYTLSKMALIIWFDRNVGLFWIIFGTENQLLQQVDETDSFLLQIYKFVEKKNSP